MVSRAAPCLLGLHSLLASPFHPLPESERTGAVVWPGEIVTTVSDASATVRRWLRDEALLPQAGGDAALNKLLDRVRELLLTPLAHAA